MDLMWFLLLAHLTGDYALQTDRMARQKGGDLPLLAAHVAIYTLCIGIALWAYAAATGLTGIWRWNTGGLLIPLFAIHFLQDYTKCRFFPSSKQAYYADQVLHLAQLYIIRLLAL